jgi:hypothetical protein
MDWKYKHFNQQAVFNAPGPSLLEAARTVVAESFGEPHDTPEGFAASGYSAWHAATATFRLGSVPTGTQLSVELLVERSGGRSYMLVDIGGYYNAQIDKWFTRISERLGASGGQVLVSKSTINYRFQQACLAGCAVWLVLGACLGVAATALDRARLAQAPASFPGVFSIAVSVVALLAGLAVFLLVAYPELPPSRSIHEQLRRIQGK